MTQYEQAKKLAKEALARAEGALQAYSAGIEYDHERFRRLAAEVGAARRQLLDLLSDLCPEETKTPMQVPEPPTGEARGRGDDDCAGSAPTTDPA